MHRTVGLLIAALFAARAFAAAPPRRLVFLGDSLTAGYMLAVERAYPYLLQQRVAAAGLAWDVKNAGISGDTSAGALRRVEALVKDPPGLLVVWIGANDGLRGQDIGAMNKNVDAILAAAQAHRVPTMLVQMKIPPNYGPDYTARFEAVYPELAKKYGVPLIPFPMEAVAGEPDLNLADGVHPNAKGHALIADALWKALEARLRQ